jgi:hypothetical protein
MRLEENNLETVNNPEKPEACLAKAEKTQEEKRQGNINRLTAEAKSFIAEKRQARELKEAQEKLEDLKGKEIDEVKEDQKGEIVPIEEFKRKYKVIDPGVNLKFNNHDDFMGFLLKPTGYQAMIETSDAYLGK